MQKLKSKLNRSHAFTIIELIVVIAVIGILATISIFGYGSWKASVANTQIKSDLNAVNAAMENARTFTNNYPTTLPATVTPSENVTITLASGSSTTAYCVDGVSSDNPSNTYYLASETKDKGALTGTCSGRPSTTPPSVPTNLAVTSVSADQIGLSWTTVSGATSYDLQCASDTAFVAGFRTANSASSSGTVTGLQSVSTHYCRIKAVNASGSSAYSSYISIDTTTYLPPTGLAVTSTNNTQIVLSWSATSYANSYNVECALDTGFTSGVKTTNTVSSSGTVSGLTPHKTYYCHVNAVPDIGIGAWSSTVTTGTTTNFGTIAAATGLSESSLAGSTADANWTGISCSLGTPLYRFVWVSPQTSATAWISVTAASVTFSQVTTNTWKVESKCTYDGVNSSASTSSNKVFTSTVDAPAGAFGTIGWNGQFTFDANNNTYTCTSPASEQYQLVSTLINTTSSTINYGWSTTTSKSITGVNQGSKMTTYLQVRCYYSSVSSTVYNTSSRTDNASVNAPGSVPGWCAGTCGSPRGDRWSAVSCPTGTTASYWSYAVGNYSNAVWGAYEATGFYGYDRGYYSYGDTMINDYLKARCLGAYANSGYGPQSYAYY